MKSLSITACLGLASVDAFLARHSRARHVHGSVNKCRSASELFSNESFGNRGAQIDDSEYSSRRGFLFSAAAMAAVLGSMSSPSVAAAVDAVSSAATCDATVSVWQRGNRLVYLLGTAHISEQSSVLAGQLVKDTHPSAVFVELDLRRVADGSTVGVNKDGIVSTQLGVDPGASPRSRVVIPQVIPVSEREGSGDLTLASAATASGGTLSAASQTPAPSTPFKPNWFRRTLTDWGAALVGKAIRGLYSNLGDAGFSPGEEFVVAINEGQAMGRYVMKSNLTFNSSMDSTAHLFALRQ